MNQAASSSEVNLSIEHGLPIAGHSRLTKVESKYSAQTPLAARPRIDPLDLVRMVATARLVLPASIVRLSAGRSQLGREAQILCFLAGANSIFAGDTLLTTPNAEPDEDALLFAALAPRSGAAVAAA